MKTLAQNMKDIADKLYLYAVSQIGQPIEVCYNWLIEKRAFKEHPKSVQQKDL